MQRHPCGDQHLSRATTATYERSYVEDDAKAGDTLGMSTDDLTNNATGAGEAENSNTEDTTSGESYTEDTTGSEETTGDTTGGEEHVEPSACRNTPKMRPESAGVYSV